MQRLKRTCCVLLRWEMHRLELILEALFRGKNFGKELKSLGKARILQVFASAYAWSAAVMHRVALSAAHVLRLAVSGYARLCHRRCIFRFLCSGFGMRQIKCKVGTLSLLAYSLFLPGANSSALHGSVVP